ncbi:hypothetical protein RJ640_004541 [Escallonia rubra]|uniref:VAL1-3 N-terminal zinc finger domain-containing protein n=1 Tax=Escallonia rubra TaxID=112253 RepID=A0AA88RSI1_9ASTE|nr:hypothetical protein RJ640_004541 [Escallonia rubra]
MRFTLMTGDRIAGGHWTVNWLCNIKVCAGEEINDVFALEKHTAMLSVNNFDAKKVVTNYISIISLVLTLTWFICVYSSVFEEGRFCETFHSNDDGWRDCESCGKRLRKRRQLRGLLFKLKISNALEQ